MSKERQPAIRWEPQEDITTYELAQAMSLLAYEAHVRFRDIKKRYDELPPEVQRHFKLEVA